MRIGGLQKLTLIDYPGKLACTVFLAGCNFRCQFCYSGELVLPEKIKNHTVIPEKEFFDFLQQKKGLLEGVVLCGGEPCLNEELPELCRKIKEMGFLIKLDTNGSNPGMLKSLVNDGLIDYVAMDLKTNKENYEKIVGVSVDINKIQDSIDFLRKGTIDYEFRSTIVPSIHERENIIEMANWIKGAKKYYLQGFRPGNTINPALEKQKPYPKEYLSDVQKEVSSFFGTCQVR